MEEKLHDLEMRNVYARTLIELADKNSNVLVLEADLSKASGTNPTFVSAHPDKFVNVGVAEANMIGIGAGLAVEGKIPFCASFSPFATRRVYDQVTISVAYANTNVKIVGTAPGITAGPNGGTHMCFQDLAIMRAMPNMIVLSPCDVYELRSCLRWMAEHEGPVYMQLIRMKQPKVFDESYTFNPDRAVKLREGKDVTLVSTGYMTPFAVQASDELAEEGVSVELLHYPCVKPFDTESLVESARKTGRVVTVETQNIIGGLGGAVCETLSEQLPTPVKRLGIPDKFGEVATEEYLFNKHGFGLEHIKASLQGD
ncbi:MAG: transketolase family protein [Armatimonadota bacterium]